jgi:hypothetical protein
MRKVQAHEIQLKASFPTGAEEWHCHTCGRRLMMMAPPGCEMIALEYGDSYILVWGDEIGAIRAVKILIEKGDDQVVHYGKMVDEDGAAPASAQGEENLSLETSLWTELLEDIDFGDL